jgi:hypothetical protein
VREHHKRPQRHACGNHGRPHYETGSRGLFVAQSSMPNAANQDGTSEKKQTCDEREHPLACCGRWFAGSVIGPTFGFRRAVSRERSDCAAWSLGASPFDTIV